MSATAFQLYNSAKKAIGAGDIMLGVSALQLKLTTSASNASTLTLSTFGSVDNECAGGGYAAKTLNGVAWTVGASAGSYKLDADDLVFTANGSSIIGIKYAVIGIAGGKALCWSRLSAAQFDVTTPNTCTIQFNTLGLFEMH